MHLISVTFKTIPRMPGISPGNLVEINMAKSGALNGWRILVRGQQVWLVSPVGWTQDQSVRRSAPTEGAVTVYEIPRADVVFHWRADDLDDVQELLKTGKYESPPIGPPKVPDAREAAPPVPANQMGDA